MTAQRTAEEQRRVRRRRWLLWGALPLWLGAFLYGGYLTAVHLAMNGSVGQYSQGDYENAGWASLATTSLSRLNPFERWKPPFATGTAFVADDDPQLGLFYLDTALDRVPDEHRCMVQTNRAIALEGIGDLNMDDSRLRAEWAAEAQGYVDAGEPYPQGAPWERRTPEDLREEAQMWADAAAAMYADAQLTRQDPACDENPPPPEQQQQDADAQDRLDQKQQEAEEAGEPEPQDGQSEADAEAERQRRLRERNAEAEAEAERRRQEDNDPGAGSETKSW